MNKLPHNHNDFIDDLLKNIPNNDALEKVSTLFQQLCDPTRLKILWLLCHAEECVSNIAALINMSSPAVSHHLRFLKQTNIISSRRIGKEVHYKIADNDLSKLVHKMIDAAFDMHCDIK